ncbi:choice-of-anchor L domain-containing protein [Desulfonatronum parangueonense]
MVNRILGNGVVISNVTYTGSPLSAGIFNDGENAGIGINEGIILSSGKVEHIIGPNTSTGISYSAGTPGDADLDNLSGGITYDAAVLEFDFIPEGDQLNFDFVFGSEEYNEYVGSPFNDVFGFFIDGQNIAIVPGTTDPISINNVNLHNNSNYYVNNEKGIYNTEADGFTKVINIKANVTPGNMHRMKIAIADVGDSSLDSWVMIAANSFSTSPSEAIYVNRVEPFDITTQERAQNVLENLDKVIIYKDSIRADLGAMQNRLANTITNLSIQADSLSAAESRISDADISLEMTAFVRNQILTQSAVAMLAQANALPRMALQVIQG